MSFIVPEFLYALGLLVFPILIHLFNFRRFKTVYFSQVKFLKNIKQETQSTSKLKHLLVLISRCLAIAALVFAFAQPFIPTDEAANKVGKKGVSIYLDNSFSMLSKAEEGTLLEVGKTKAKAIAEAYASSDRFQLLTNEFSAKQQRWLNREDFLLNLQEVEASPIFRTIAQVQNRLKQTSNETALNIERYLISDLQKVSMPLKELTDTAKYLIIPVQSQELSNINLSEVQFFNPYHLPDQLEQISIKLKNETEPQASKIPTQLHLNGKLKSPFVIDFPAQDTVNKAFNYRNPIGKQLSGKVIIKDYPITFDDTLYFSYPIQSEIKVLSIYENTPNPNINALFKSDSLINFSAEPIKNIDYSALNKSQLIVLEEVDKLTSALQQALINFVKNGGSLSIFPSAEMNTTSFNKLLQGLAVGQYQRKIKPEANVSSLNEQSGLFKDVFDELPKNLQLPNANSYWEMNVKSRSLVENIMRFRSGNPFLSAFEVDKGKLYLSAVGLNAEQSNLVNHALFVPLLYNMALQAGVSQPNYYDLNQTTFSLPAFSKKESPVHIKGHGIDFIPAQHYLQNELKVELNNEITKAGHYQLLQENELVGQISFNYNRKESAVETFAPNEFEAAAKIQQLNFQLLNEKVDVLRSKIEKLDQGTPLWKYFIILALIFLAIEIILLRYLK